MIHEEVIDSTGDWHVNESNLAVPVQDVEPFVTEVLTDENSEIPENSLGPALLIGLDKNFFENGDDTKNVIFIENSEIKIDGASYSGNKSFLSSGNYLISFVDRSKVLAWENSTLRNVRKMRQEGSSLVDELYADHEPECIESGLQSMRQISEPVFFKSGGNLADNVRNVRKIKEGGSSLEENLYGEPEPDSLLSSLQGIRHAAEPGLFKSVENLAEEVAVAPAGSFLVEQDVFIGKNDPKALVNELEPGNSAEECLNRRIGDIISEERLPLKKKSKMKGLETAHCDLTDEELPINSNDMNLLPSCVQIKFGDSKKDSTLNNKNSIVDKTAKVWKKQPRRKRRCCYSESDSSDNDGGDTADWRVLANPQDYNGPNDLVDDLKSQKIVDEDFAKLILTGISQMKTDVIEELKGPCIKEETFSYELLAFAFLLYFNRRPAYQYLRCVFKTQWPTVKKLKEWKKLVNSKPKRRRRSKKPYA